MNDTLKYAPGGDAQAISVIAKRDYGGLLEMFTHHGWPERGNQMMPAQGKRVVERYGSIRRFEEAHHPGIKMTPQQMWSGEYSILLTSFWGWGPERWGTVGFTDLGRRETILKETSDPFIVVIYLTKNAQNAPPDMRGMITGFYLVSHIAGHRNEFTAPEHFDREPEKWQHSLRALRAFSFLPEYRLHIDEFDATVSDRAQSVAKSAEFIRPELVARLHAIPFVEVPVWGSTGQTEPVMRVETATSNMVRSGPANRSGYMVSGEPVDTEKELYALVLNGDTSAFLGEAAGERRIFKIGLSMSPKTRLETFRKSMPKGAFEWAIFRSTRADRDAPYPCFESAEAGEMAMKKYLGAHSDWLGGEFYAATNAQLEAAWKEGRECALNWPKRGDKRA